MIKHFLLIFVVFVNFQVNAGEIDGVCGLNSCTSKMNSILSEYIKGNRDIETPGVFSGECFHKTRMYNPEHAHFGGILIDKKEKEDYFGGAFTFFAPDNPYRGLNTEAARSKFNIKYEKKNQIAVKDNGYYVDLNVNQIPLWRYYFSQRDGILNLIGVWGVEHIIFCEMSKH